MLPKLLVGMEFLGVKTGTNENRAAPKQRIFISMQNLLKEGKWDKKGKWEKNLESNTW